jgi:hypothetical protein
MDVFMKLEFDLKRLREATSTKDLQFAALDLAVWGFHMIDWVLNSVTDERHVALCGQNRKARPGQITKGFIERQSIRIGTIGMCGQIANTGKHRVLTLSKDDPSFTTNHTIKFRPAYVAGEEYRGRISAEAYLKDTSTGQEIEASIFFATMIEQWREFLKAERLYDWDYDYEPPEPDAFDL